MRNDIKVYVKSNLTSKSLTFGFTDDVSKSRSLNDICRSFNQQCVLMAVLLIK